MKRFLLPILFLVSILIFPSKVAGQDSISFYLSYSGNCEPLDVTIINTSNITTFNGGPYYSWSLDGLQFSTEEFPASIQLDAGEHMIEFMVSDDDGSLGYRAQDILVLGIVDTFKVRPAATACPGEELYFDVYPEPSYIEWDFGDVSYLGNNISFDFHPSHSYDNPGTYTVQVGVTNECGSNTFSQEIVISSTNIPEFSPFTDGSSVVCPNEEISFNVEGDFAGYLWDFGDGTTSTRKNPVHAYADQGDATYTVKLSVTNKCGNTSTDSLEVTIGTFFEANAGFDYNTETGYIDPCPGTDINFNAYNSGTHFWDFGDGGASTLRYPTYQYSAEGDYQVTHVIVSGCNTKDTVTSNITIASHPEEVPYDLFFYLEDYSYSWEELMYNDTFEICQGQVARFKNTTSYEGIVNYEWDFGDGGNMYGRDAEHVFSSAGIYAVILTATTNCGGTTSASKYINVSNTLQPVVELGILPQVICPEEFVYFFDDNFDPQHNYTYNIDFGDGTTLNGITYPTDIELGTLASHQYADGGPYNFSLEAVNQCGNSSEVTGSITVDADPARTPFYFVSNSTQGDDAVEPQDWSVRNDQSDHQFEIFVQWPIWTGALDNTFFVYFWYGGLYVDPEPGMPDGFIQFTSNTIDVGQTVTAYVPMDLAGNTTVGIAAGYYCGGVAKFEDEPEAWGTLLDAGSVIVNEVPLISEGYTDITTYSPSGIIIDPLWDGVCNDDSPEGTWYRDMGSGIFAVMDIYDNEGFLQYSMSYQDGLDNYNQINTIGYGEYSYPNAPDITTIRFQDYICGSPADYTYLKPTPDELQFNPATDDCPERVEFLNGIFQRKIDNNDNKSTCPGDLVKFRIAGGVSYVWDFGDGANSTEQFPLHTYLSSGTYNAQVIATNACGKKDTLFTKVLISDSNPPPAGFQIENWEIFRMDTVYFRYDNYDYDPGSVDNNIYSWDFGDGKSSSLANPVHVYSEAGEYLVQLDVTNGCGTNHAENWIFVRPKQVLCEAKFDFSILGTEVSFYDMSVGEPSAWEWNFDNGDIDITQNPVYDFGSDGVYWVTLNIYNEINNCISSVEKRIVIGTLECDAGFTYLMNNTTGLVKFTNTSLNSDELSWDFGDNTFSNLSNPEHTFKTAGIYPVCLTIFNTSTGCQSTYCEEIIIGQTDTTFLNADFSFFVHDDQQTVTFSDLSAGNPTNWYWTTGDGKMYTTPEIVHTYSGPGIFPVCLVVFDENTGESDQICKEITVGTLTCDIEAKFGYYINTTTREVIFEDNSNGDPEYWYWTFGDGTSSKKPSPSHTYSSPGFYLVTLSVYNSTNDCMDHYAEFLQVGEVECRAKFEYTVDPTTRTVQFYNTSVGPIENVYWDFGNGRYSKLKNPSVTYLKDGIFPVTLTVIDSNQLCMDVTLEEVQVGSIDCSAAFGYYIDSLNLEAHFQTMQIGVATQLLWIFGDGTYNTQTNPVHKFVAPGYYTVSLNTYNSNLNCMDYYEETLLIGSEGQDCKSDFIFQPLDDDDLTIQFRERASGNIQSQNWNFGDGIISQELEPEHSYSRSGYYLTCLTVYNNFGIPNMKCKWVPVVSETDARCRADFMFTVDSLSREVRFNDISYGEPDTWLWDFGDGNTSSEQNPVHVYDVKDYYTVILESSNSTTGCSSKEVKVINVAEENLLKARYTYSVPEDGGKKVGGYPVDFVGASSGEGATFEWDFGDENLKAGFYVHDSTSMIVTYYYQEPGTYNACLRVTDPITSQSDTYCQSVTTGEYVNTPELDQNRITLAAFPNPANEFTNIRFKLPERTFVEIAIFDELGRRVETMVRAIKDADQYDMLFDVSGYQAGIYHIKLMTKDRILVTPIVIAR